MANEEGLGPRKTMFVLVIVVGCFAVLWPRILSPLIVGHTRDQLKPNQIDREAGCCEVIFEGEMAVLQLVNEVCNSAVQVNGKLSPYAAAECRRAVNESCGVDIAAFLKRSDNVGKSSKMLVATLRDTNSSCLKEHFGVSPTWSFTGHPALSWELLDKVKQERSPIRGAGPHPALRERGRAIPATAPAPPSRGPVPMPPHARVRSSPLSVYYEPEVKPPPIPGMRPPLGSPGGPVQAPKSSMGFVLPIYTICIIVFFVYTLSKILFKRTGGAYEPMDPDPQFRRRVFRQESMCSSDQLVVTAISGLVAEVHQQMEASYTQNQQRQETQDDSTRPYTNGTVLHNSGPVHIVASEYKDVPKEKTPEPKELSPEPKEPSPEPKEPSPEPKELRPEPIALSPEPEELSPEPKELSPEPKESSKESSPEEIEPIPLSPEAEITLNHKGANGDIKKATDNYYEVRKDESNNSSDDFLREERAELDMEKQSTPELLEEALIEDSPDRDVIEENASVKVVGMETCAHAADGGACAAPARPAPLARKAEEVQSIFLETSIPQQTRVLIADCADRADEQTQPPAKHAPLVVSGKMTLSLIQDAPRDTPEREQESTVDEFTTASALTQAANEEEEEYSEEEVEEEIEEEIEEEEDADESKPEKK